MNPLEKRKLLKEGFKIQKKQQNKQKRKLIHFKELDIKFEQETFEWYKNLVGGGNHE
ncbi:hypothetical protein [Anoxybacillus ayderensis]|uniref:hypothetical protein n=1 Tax=Anoxybacillus ayderensis TaxID=265546 RepID=UPI002E210634|nr:hypothetical protein [Anoxybacillus ayderensis]